jgi:hypothetical protein
MYNFHQEKKLVKMVFCLENAARVTHQALKRFSGIF